MLFLGFRFATPQAIIRAHLRRSKASALSHHQKQVNGFGGTVPTTNRPSAVTGRLGGALLGSRLNLQHLRDLVCRTCEFLVSCLSLIESSLGVRRSGFARLRRVWHFLLSSIAAKIRSSRVSVLVSPDGTALGGLSKKRLAIEDRRVLPYEVRVTAPERRWFVPSRGSGTFPERSDPPE